MPPSENPYASPQVVSKPPENPRVAASKRLRAVSVVLFAISCLEIAFGLIGVLDSISQLCVVYFWYGETLENGFIMLDPSLIFASVTLVRGSIGALGSWRMHLVRGYRLSIAAVVSSLAGIIYPMTWFSVPFGLWALVILLQKETRTAFAEINQPTNQPAAAPHPVNPVHPVES